ncbi:GNAT family N-acetyltransferase [Mesorhizobium sp. WSM3860]|uniref:GNAT family N-acetyltransferase n=1 Tax=Mesorhizobium sp. WSM3860 TaxID=2029403 RepID=UPI000BAEFA86|nr:GNAT family N-acetyltransferase [Mesorhizobium sp. WSM3860]PBC06282.1 GNAT family N-acetyltransferase [Mesorhizobium sp. WSM3860]
MITIVERDIAAFFRAPFNAYGDATPYVSPMLGDLRRSLSSKTNPLFASEDDFSFFAVLRDGRPIGRITAHVHRASNELHRLNRAYFGYFDCADDAEAAAGLLGAAESWARRRGYSEIIGNFNLTAMQQAGVMIEGFENQPYTDQVWGPPHLPRLLEANAYAGSFPMTTFEQDISTLDAERLITPERRMTLNAEGFAFAPVTRATLADRLDDARAVLNASFRENPMFVPVTKQEFDFQAKEMKWVMDPRISTVLHRRGQAVGAVIAIPDLNPLVKAAGARIGWSTPWHYLRHRLARHRAVVIFQGVLPEYQGLGLNPLMLAHALGAMRDAGYRTVGGTWIADVNKASLRQAEKSGARPLHRLQLYSKAL